MPAVNPEIEAGRLDRRVTLMEPVLNEESDEIDSWQDRGRVWAAVEPHTISADETSASGRMVTITPVLVIMR